MATKRDEPRPENKEAHQDYPDHPGAPHIGEEIPMPDFPGEPPAVEKQLENIDADVHARILHSINRARRHEDLAELELCGADHGFCQALLAKRDQQGAYGFRTIQEIRDVAGLSAALLAKMLALFGPGRHGKWIIKSETALDGQPYHVAHAAVLHTGKVLFLPEADWYPTLIWDPADDSLSLPANAPTDYLFCAGHSFLFDGQLLVVGGGGGGPSGVNRAWRFDPDAATWTKTAGDMSQARWYPTAVTLASGRKILVVGGAYANATTEVYDYYSDSFLPMQGASSTRSFPQLYPGLHLLPGGEVFYSRTGFGSSGQGPGGGDPTASNAYLRFTAPDHGEWIELDKRMEHQDRVRGMSILILQPGFLAPVRVMVIGGTSQPGSETAEIIVLSTLNPGWRHPSYVPGGAARINVNAVLLPDNTIFVVGGTSDPSVPCARYEPHKARWREMAQANYRKQYHSIAVLLPSGEVLATGGSNYGGGSRVLEVFRPPYLYDIWGGRAARPTIRNAPATIAGDFPFVVDSPEAAIIERMVLVRPMAVTHQTDSEQRVIPLHFTRRGTRLTAALEHHADPSLAPAGYYMLFIIDSAGVPSIARWVRLE